MKVKQRIKKNYNEVYSCSRCRDDYCGICNPPIEINFDVLDGVIAKQTCQSYEEYKRLKEDKRVIFVGGVRDYKGYRVCPYCYEDLFKKSKDRELQANLSNLRGEE